MHVYAIAIIVCITMACLRAPLGNTNITQIQLDHELLVQILAQLFAHLFVFLLEQGLLIHGMASALAVQHQVGLVKHVGFLL